MIFQSSRAMAGGVIAARVCWARPSVLTYVAFFSVYAAAGRTISAIAAPASPCEPELPMPHQYKLPVKIAQRWWAVATYGCESWTLRKNEEIRLDAVEMKGLRTILGVSWTAKKTNEWVLNKAGVKSELLDTVKARKLAYYGHTMRKQGCCLEKEIMQGTMPGARRRGRPRTAWIDNIKTWTGLSVEESIRMSEDREIWRKYVYGVANPRIEDG